MNRKGNLVAAAVLFGLVVAMQWQMQAFRGAKSITFDETFYLACATNTVARGRLDPALVNHGAAPLPVLVSGVPAVLGRAMLGDSVKPRRAYWRGEPGDPALIARARLVNSGVVGTALLAIVYLWLWSAAGTAAAIAGGTLVAFSPAVIAHGSLATTDSLAAVGWLVGLLAVARYDREPTVLRAAIAGLAAGLAVSAKYSAVLIGVVFVGVAIHVALDRRVGRRSHNSGGASGGMVAADAAMSLAVFAYVAFVLAWAAHGFATARIAQAGVYRLPADSWMTILQGVDLPAPVAGIMNQQLHNLDPQPAMLMGEVRKHGWWYYYPVAASMKATPSEAAVLLVGLAVGLSRLAGVRPRGGEAPSGVDPRSDCRDFPRVSTSVCGMALAVGVVAMFLVRVQIGIRYLLPLATVAALYCVSQLARSACVRLRSRRAGRWTAGFVVLLLLGQIASCVHVAPHHLAYVAPYWGGPRQAYRRLADSNVDWGQDLPALKRVLEELPPGRVVLSYFGTADPDAYGIDATPLERVRGNPSDRLGDYDYLAVSVNHLYGIDGNRSRGDLGLEDFRDEEPIAHAGHSIHVYELRDRDTKTKQKPEA